MFGKFSDHFIIQTVTADDRERERLEAYLNIRQEASYTASN